MNMIVISCSFGVYVRNIKDRRIILQNNILTIVSKYPLMMIPYIFIRFVFIAIEIIFLSSPVNNVYYIPVSLKLKLTQANLVHG